MGGGVVQGDAEALLHPPYPVEHRVPVGEQRIAGFLQGVAAGEIPVQGLAVLGAPLPVRGGQSPQGRGNQILPPHQPPKQQGGAQLGHGGHTAPREVRGQHTFQGLRRGFVEGREGVQILHRLRHRHGQPEFLRQGSQQFPFPLLPQEQQHIPPIQKGVGLGEPIFNLLPQGALPRVNQPVAAQVRQGEGIGVKIRQIGQRNLQPEIGGGGEAPIQQVHENVLGGFEGLVLPTGLHKQLLGQNHLHGLPGLLRNQGQMPVQIHADPVPQPDPGADQGGKPAAIGALAGLYIVRRPPAQGGALADQGADLIADDPGAHRLPEDRVRKPHRRKGRRHVEGIVQYQHRAAQQRPGVQHQAAQVVQLKKLRQQPGGIAPGPVPLFHNSSSASLC